MPIVRGPDAETGLDICEGVCQCRAAQAQKLLTTVYVVAKRPKGRVLVDYNQNAWGRTLASIYSVRPRPRASVSTPVKWSELERGLKIEDFRIDNVPARVRNLATFGSRYWRNVADSSLKFIFKALVLGLWLFVRTRRG